MVSQNILYVVSDSGGSVTAVYAGNGSIKSVIDDVSGIRSLATSPDGKKVYASGSNGLYVINTSTNIATKVTIGYTDFWDVAVNPRGHEYYVSAKDASFVPYILVLNTQNDQQIMRFGMGLDGTAINLAVSPDGNKLYAGTQKSNAANFTVYDLTIRGLLNSKRVGLTEDIVVKPDGSEVYVACADGENFINTIYVFDASGSTQKYRIDTVNWPRGIVSSPDGRRLYIANSQDASVSVFDTVSRNIVKVVNLTKDDPDKISVTPDGKTIFVSHTGNVNGLSVIDTSGYSISNIENVEGRTYEMVICPVPEFVPFKPPVTVNPTLIFSPSPAAPSVTVEPSLSMTPTVTVTPVSTPAITVAPSDIPTTLPTAKPAPGFEVVVAISCLSGVAFLRKKR